MFLCIRRATGDVVSFSLISISDVEICSYMYMCATYTCVIRIKGLDTRCSGLQVFLLLQQLVI